MIKTAPKLHAKILFSHFFFIGGIFTMHWQRVPFNSSYINGPGVFLILTFQKTTTFSRETKTKNVFWTRAFVAWADGGGSKGEVQNKFCYPWPPSRYTPVYSVVT